MKTNRGMLTLMIVPVLLFIVFGWLQRGRTDATKFVVDSILIRRAVNGLKRTPTVKIEVAMRCDGIKPQWWGNNCSVWTQNPRFVHPNGKEIRLHSFGGYQNFNPHNRDIYTGVIEFDASALRDYKLMRGSKFKTTIVLGQNGNGKIQQIAFARGETTVPFPFQ